MAQQEFKIQKDIIKSMFNTLCNIKVFKVEKNHQLIINLLLKELPVGAKEAIIHLMLTNKLFEITKIGDYVKLTPNKYHIGNEFEIDILEDMGLLHPGDENEPYYVYGQVIKDGSWDSNLENYNGLHAEIYVKLMYHDKDKKIKFVDHNISPLQAIKINKSSIKYFDIQKKLHLLND